MQPRLHLHVSRLIYIYDDNQTVEQSCTEGGHLGGERDRKALCYQVHGREYCEHSSANILREKYARFLVPK